MVAVFTTRFFTCGDARRDVVEVIRRGHTRSACSIQILSLEVEIRQEALARNACSIQILNLEVEIREVALARVRAVFFFYLVEHQKSNECRVPGLTLLARVVQVHAFAFRLPTWGQ